MVARTFTICLGTLNTSLFINSFFEFNDIGVRTKFKMLQTSVSDTNFLIKPFVCREYAAVLDDDLQLQPDQGLQSLLRPQQLSRR